MKLKKLNKEYLIVFLIFVFGFLVRLWSILPYNTIIGFDQARDLFAATTIFRDHNLAIIGPTAGNNVNLHHGVLFWYYLIPGLVLFNGNPIGAVIVNSFFNALASVILYLLGRDIFKSLPAQAGKRIGLIAAIIASVSYYYVQFAGWLSNPTGTFFTLPIFFYGVWKYYQGKRWGLPIAAFFLGLTIQFELFFIYLIPTGVVLWIVLRPKLPSLKLFLISLFLFCVATFTMILSEIKFNFGGFKSILFSGNLVGGQHDGFINLLIVFLENKWETFYLNLWPQERNIGTLIGIIVVIFLIYEVVKNTKFRRPGVFLLIWFFSPAIMFLLGQHNAPWFYIGRPASAILITSYVIAKIRYKFLIYVILFFIIIMNLTAIKNSIGRGQMLLEPDPASIMSDQMKAIDYTYASASSGQAFSINTLTNPLYVNAVWGYHYYWYGKNKYGYLPSFVGGDQLYPYNTLNKPVGKEKLLYLLIDTTSRIPPQYRNEIMVSSDKMSKLIETKKFGGIEVQKRVLNERSLTY